MELIIYNKVIMKIIGISLLALIFGLLAYCNDIDEDKPFINPIEFKSDTLAPVILKNEGIDEIKIFFGDLHHHTTLSDGQEEIDIVISYVKNKKIVDFMAITDHSQYFDNPDNQSQSESWKRIHESCDLYNENGVFLVIPGFEWSKNSQIGTEGLGHINTFNTGWWATANSDDISVEKYYDLLVDSPGSLSMFNHPSPKQFNSFAYYTPARDEKIVLFEIATRSGRPSFIPRLPAYIAALDKGWHLAPSNNTDIHNHPEWWTENCFGRTAIIADTLTREALYDALQNRRAYATYDKNLRVNFVVNDKSMGSILNKPEYMDATIEVHDPDNQEIISKIEILTEEGEIFASKEFDSNRIEWNIELDVNKKYFFLKITQADGDLAFSAPIWSGR
jgi:hypothetical protein